LEAGRSAPEHGALEYYRELVRPIFGNRRIILVGGPIAGLTPLARQLRSLGAARPFLLGSSRGTGALPEPDEAEWHSLDIHAEGMIEGIRAYERRLRDLPREACEALDRYDPERSAMVLGLIFLGAPPAVAGRRVYALRDPGWARFEDKTLIDGLWDAIEVERSPSRIVAVEEEALRSAAKVLDLGVGTVWAGDAREGLHGGAAYLRWVRSEEGFREALRFFAQHCDRVRVMPFLEGIPCSIHGVVLPDRVLAFRPVEQITLRPTQRPSLLYAGLATFWDPPAADREAMRALARRTGEALRERARYRGPFTIDGVMSEGGFRPTELNARFGAGLGVIARSMPTLPLAPILLAVQAGEPLDLRPDLLEELVVEGADARRGGGGWTVIPEPRNAAETHPLVDEGTRYRRAQPNEAADAVLSIGPSDVGGFVYFAPDPKRVEVGRSLAPRVVRGLEAADRECGTRIGPLGAARDVR
jgi:hypothetical protein